MIWERVDAEHKRCVDHGTVFLHLEQCGYCRSGNRKRPTDLEVPAYWQWIPNAFATTPHGRYRCDYHPAFWFLADEACGQCLDEDVRPGENDGFVPDQH